MNQWRVTEDFSIDQCATRPKRVLDKKEAKQRLQATVEQIAALQERLYAEDRQALLLIFQAVAMIFSSAVFARSSWYCVSNLNQEILPVLFGILIPCTLPYFFGGLFFALVFSSSTKRSVLKCCMISTTDSFIPSII